VKLARVAACQHGVVSAAQLAALGLSREAIRKRTLSGRLHRLHRGVYAVGHAAPSLHRGFMAAVLSCGEGAVLSHSSAAVLWNFLKPIRGPIHVSLPGLNGRRRRDGIVVHRCISLARSNDPLTRVQIGIPVTTPRRTIEDLPAALPPHLARRAKRQAEFLGYELGLPTDRSRSDLESDFLAFCRRHRLPLPEVNVPVGPYTVDFLWPNQRVAVETDFFDYHRGSVAFEDDRQRELDLRRAGYAARRYTGAQIRNHPALVVADLREALSRG